MYKIITNLLGNTSIKIENSFIPQDPENSDYQQFIKDVAEQGMSIVEGPDVIESSYVELRVSEYPSREDQLDMMYWDAINSTTTWQDLIASIKDKHPKTITGGTTIGDVPSWVQTAADNWTFNKQLREYVEATERLSQYVLSEGRPEIREDVVIGTKEVFNEETIRYETIDITQNLVTQTAIAPLESTIEVTEINSETLESTTNIVKNPLIVKDEEERTAAQSVVDATPQNVIDSIST